MQFLREFRYGSKTYFRYYLDYAVHRGRYVYSASIAANSLFCLAFNAVGCQFSGYPEGLPCSLLDEPPHNAGDEERMLYGLI